MHCPDRIMSHLGCSHLLEFSASNTKELDAKQNLTSQVSSSQKVQGMDVPIFTASEAELAQTQESLFAASCLSVDTTRASPHIVTRPSSWGFGVLVGLVVLFA